MAAVGAGTHNVGRFQVEQWRQLFLKGELLEDIKVMPSLALLKHFLLQRGGGKPGLAIYFEEEMNARRHIGGNAAVDYLYLLVFISCLIPL